MKVFCLLIVLIFLPQCIPAQQTYTNPIDSSLQLSDPYILRHEQTYYLYASTDLEEGFRAWKSTNLVDWEPIGWIFQKTESTWGQKAFWAPEVIYQEGKFYLIYSSSGQTIFGQGMRICIAVSKSPEGPFEELHAPLFDFGYSTIDAHIYREDDRAYLYFEKVGSVGEYWNENGFLWGHIFGVELSHDLSTPLHEPKLCLIPEQDWEGIHKMWARSNEGMTVFKHDDTYYMMYSANHWADSDYAIGYATSDRPLGGLWTKHPGNPILSKDLKNGVSGPGHNSIIRSPDDSELFIVYHTHVLTGNKNVNRTLNPAKGEILGRTLNIDRLKILKDGSLKVTGPTHTPQPMPSGIK